MSTITATQHSLEELARTVNRLIETKPDRINPKSDIHQCMYFHPDTMERCIFGQALFEMTGLNVPEIYEGEGIDELLTDPEFCDHFGLPTSSKGDDILRTMGGVQWEADLSRRWGALVPINVEDAA